MLRLAGIRQPSLVLASPARLSSLPRGEARASILHHLLPAGAASIRLPQQQPPGPAAGSRRCWQGSTPADAESPRLPHRACLPQRHRCRTRSPTGRKRHFSSAKRHADTASELQHCSGTEARAAGGFAHLAQSWRRNFQLDSACQSKSISPHFHALKMSQLLPALPPLPFCSVQFVVVTSKPVSKDLQCFS